MKNSALLAIALAAVITACDVQSGITKKSLEKYNPTPTPERSATPEEKIDPADIVTVDTTAAGPNLSVNKPEEGRAVKCDKYNRLTINGDEKEVKIEGACSRIMINGDKNRVTVAAVSEIVLNGHDNTVEYLKYANGKKPIVTDSGAGNIIAKAAAPDPKEK